MRKRVGRVIVDDAGNSLVSRIRTEKLNCKLDFLFVDRLDRTIVRSRDHKSPRPETAGFRTANRDGSATRAGHRAFPIGNWYTRNTYTSEITQISRNGMFCSETFINYRLMRRDREIPNKKF